MVTLQAAVRLGCGMPPARTLREHFAEEVRILIRMSVVHDNTQAKGCGSCYQRDRLMCDCNRWPVISSWRAFTASDSAYDSACSSQGLQYTMAVLSMGRSAHRAGKYLPTGMAYRCA
jgi:hypothetical protein